MAVYSVRSVILWPEREGQKLDYLYEERITLWQAESMDDAIDLAEAEAKEYADGDDFIVLGLFQGYSISEADLGIEQGTEVFSLLRESDLDPDAYLDAFFDTGHERQGAYGED